MPRRKEEPVIVETEGQKLFVHPFCPPLSCLQTITVEADNSSTGFQLRRVPKPLYELHPWDAETMELMCRKGLEPAINLLLSNAGRRVRRSRVGRDTAQLPPRQLCSERVPYESALNWMQSAPNGLFLADPSRLQVDRLIHGISLSYPTATIAVVSQSVSRLRELASQLRTIGQAPRTLAPRSQPEELPHLALCTFFGLGACNASQYEIIIAWMHRRHSVSWHRWPWVMPAMHACTEFCL